MFSTKSHGVPSRRQLRSFGLILAGGFLFIGLWPMIWRHHNANRWAIVISVIFAVSALVVPTALRQVFRVWMTAGDCLGWINSKVILGGLYYVLLTPLRLLFSMFRRDPMNRSFDREAVSYRVPRNSRPASHMRHQF